MYMQNVQLLQVIGRFALKKRCEGFIFKLTELDISLEK